MQRQVIGHKVAAVDKAEVLEQFVGDEQQRDGAPPTLPSARVKIAVDTAEQKRERGHRGKDREVERTKVRPAKVRGDGIDGLPEISHEEASLYSF